MKSRLLALVAFALLTGPLAATATAIGTYTDRAAWRIAAGGGTGDLVEDFSEGYNQLPADVGMFAISETGDGGALVTAAQVLVTNVDSWGPNDTITFTFEHAINALGFWVTPDSDDVGARISFATNTLDTGHYYLPSSAGEEFRGFVFSGPITVFTIDHTAGGFYGLYGRHTIDNVEAFSTPEPSSVVLFGLGLAGLALARRRKR